MVPLSNDSIRFQILYHVCKYVVCDTGFKQAIKRTNSELRSVNKYITTQYSFVNFTSISWSASRTRAGYRKYYGSRILHPHFLFINNYIFTALFFFFFAQAISPLLTFHKSYAPWPVTLIDKTYSEGLPCLTYYIFNILPQRSYIQCCLDYVHDQ